jgi:threonine dehydratase
LARSFSEIGPGSRSYGRHEEPTYRLDFWGTQSGALPVHAFDQRQTLLGQGTIGLELENQIEDLDTLLVPVGGGGLIGGIAAWCARKIRVIGVEPEASPTLTRALAPGRPIDVETGGIAAASPAPRRVGERVFPIAERYVERVVLVSDDAIQAAQVALWATLRAVAEPGGAAALRSCSPVATDPAPKSTSVCSSAAANTVAVNLDH